MKLICRRATPIQAAPAAVWAVITDIKNAAQHLSAVKDIEVLEPADDDSLVGLKWRETREWMGRDAVEVMWVTEAEVAVYYETRAESHGCIYRSRLQLTPGPSATELSMAFYCQPQSRAARLMWLLSGWMAKTSLRKVIDQDLQDIKSTVERA